MTSQKQLDANRLNAQKSTGPNTPEGRDAVRFNALRHGLTAKHAVLENENEQEFQEMLEAFEAEHQPIGPTENLLVQQIVMAAWRLKRLRAVETGLFNIRMVDLDKQTRGASAQLSETERQASAFLEDNRGCGALEKLSRYETRIERSFYRALHELQRLRKNTPAAPPPDSSCLRTPCPSPPTPLSTEPVPSSDSGLPSPDFCLLTSDSCLPTSDSSGALSPVQLMNSAEQSQSRFGSSVRFAQTEPRPLTWDRRQPASYPGFRRSPEPQPPASGQLSFA